ncbi:MAG: acetylornithine aminotransferase [Piccolia ochrophora]|nr:MAG: acetylornithine aminotransferase [Piccolia ochrophora]
MALRLCSRRATGALSARSWPPRLHSVRWRNASTATASSGSNLSEEMQKNIHREASLSNPDPSADSQTSALVNDQKPYLVPTYVRPPPMFVKGEGCYLWDIENRRYLDFTAGIAVNSLGHADPELTKLIAQQAKTLIHSSNLYHNPWIGALSKLLVSETIASGGMSTASSVFISNSGSEANEAALKFARKVGKTRSSPSGPPKTDIVSFHNAFHGRTLGSLSATPNPKYQAPFLPLLPGFSAIPYDSPASSLAEHITPATAGVIIEPIQGEGGIHSASPTFLHALRDRCTDVGAVLIYDEIQCGLSRTGSLWAHSAPGLPHPDVLTTAKALGNGYPIGATLVSADVNAAIATGDHGTTFGGNPLACRIAHHVLARLAAPDLQAHVRDLERRFRAHFARLRDRFPRVVKEVRGRGLILGLQLTQDPGPVVTAARERGVLVITCGTNTLRFVPPLVLSAEQVDAGMAVVEEAMEVVFGEGEDVEGTRLKGK